MEFLRNFDWPLFASVVVLVGIGLTALWSLSPSGFFLRQIIWAVIGIAAMLLFSFIDYRIFRNHGGFLLSLLAGGLFLLTLLLIIGLETRGVVSWFRVGSITFEPVELVKLVLIVVLAKYWSARHVEVYQIRHLFISGLYVFLPVLFVLLQPDLGSAAILGFIWLSVVIFSGIRLRHLAVFLMVAALLGTFAWVSLVKPYQRERIVSFLNPYEDQRGAGYNSIQALIAVGSGGLWGKGIGFGTQSHLNFLPEAETDFIFAAIAEETGFWGVFILIAVFSFFLARSAAIGLLAKDNFSKLFALGFSALAFFQFLVHSGANIGLLPITGVTLPFVSYGGSSLVTLMIGAGVLQSIRIHARAGTFDRPEGVIT